MNKEEVEILIKEMEYSIENEIWFETNEDGANILLEYISWLKQQLEQERNKNKKAIEYINNHKTQKYSTTLQLEDYEIDELLEILKSNK